jgi:rhodanese-related sulfurtransferase
MQRYSIFLVIVLISLLAAACGGAQANLGAAEAIGERSSAPGGAYTNISVAELQTMLEAKDFVLVNTHIPFEGNIPNTDLSIPFDEIETNLDKLPTDRNAKIVLYCRSDRMSSIASEALVELGYTNISNLEGGMVAWEKAGLLLEEK